MLKKMKRREGEEEGEEEGFYTFHLNPCSSSSQVLNSCANFQSVGLRLGMSHCGPIKPQSTKSCQQLQELAAGMGLCRISCRLK